MSSEQSNILKRQEQITKWFESDTDKAPNSIKEAEKIKFSKEVQFFSACNSNDWQEIERLLGEGININCTQDDGLTSLHQACIDDDEYLVKYLIGQGADIDVQDKEGWTPLFASISCNYLPITKYLIACGARLDVVSFDGELPLDQSNNEAMTSFIKEEMKKRNLDPDEIRNRERYTMLNDIEVMTKTRDFSKFTLADNGGSLLHVAASKDYTDVLEKLLEIISPQLLNHTDNDGWNALHVAAHWGNKRACVLLVDADIDFDKVTANNQTVLEVSDDDAKPYIREEIRKARFRRQDRASVKRPAESPNTEFQPSETKITCPDTKAQDENMPIQPNCGTQMTLPNDPGIGLMRDNNTPISTTNIIEESNNIVDVDMKSSTNDVTKDENTCPVNSLPNDNTVAAEPAEITPELSQPNPINDDLKTFETNDVTLPKVITPVIPPVKPIESESQRKDKARHVRSTRRSTQGVTAEEIDEAKKIMTFEKRDISDRSSISNIPTNDNVDVSKPISNHRVTTETENKSEKNVVTNESQNVVPLLQVSDSHINGDSSTRMPTIQISESDALAPSIESLEQAEIKRKAGSHLVNKRKTRDRLPTGIVELKDIQAAQKEIVNIEVPSQQKEVEIDYKALYENELKEKEKLQRNLTRLRRDLEQSEDKVKSLQNNHIAQKPQTQASQIMPSESEIKAIERLREDNKKMKEANSALIRVISRLSHPPSKSVQSAI